MYPKLILVTLAVGTPVVYLINLHYRLSRQVQHSRRTGLPPASDPSSKGSKIESIPSNVLSNPTQYHIFYDVCWKTIQTSQLPVYDDASKLLTTYLQHNMPLFMRFPQARLISLILPDSPEIRKSFDMAHVRGLSFVQGDLACGAYRVELRTPDRVEFSVMPPEANGEAKMDGRLVISINSREDGQTVILTETVMWKRGDENITMPLERKLIRWSHELASWWLLVSGTTWLAKLGVEAKERMGGKSE